MTTQEKLMTADEFWAFAERPENLDRQLELVHGEIVEMSPSKQHGFIAGVIHGEIYIYLKQNPVARGTIETAHHVPGDKYNVRRPDLSYTRLEKAGEIDTSASKAQMPDLAVEIKTPANTRKSLHEKARFYLNNGSEMVWVVFPENRTIEVYTKIETGTIHQAALTEQDSLSGGAVLPGFSLPVVETFPE